MGSLVNAFRAAFGLDPERRERRNANAEWVQAKLDDQAARIRALDAQIDGMRKSDTILQRRAGDKH